jgi:hypothetical protein
VAEASEAGHSLNQEPKGPAAAVDAEVARALQGIVLEFLIVDPAPPAPAGGNAEGGQTALAIAARPGTDGVIVDVEHGAHV